jgi:uncharacterized protein (TIGR02118 family)
MIAAISMIRRRGGVGRDHFRRQWVDPHGVLTAELPGVRHYVQSHCRLDAPGTNALAREIAIDGFPELWFDSIEARRIAYTSPGIARCNIDSEHFIGAVSRLVTEPRVIVDRQITDEAARLILVAVGPPDPGWSDRLNARAMEMEGLVGYVRHSLLEQAAAPASRIPEFDVQVAGYATLIFETEAALLRNSTIAGSGEDSRRTAIYRVLDYTLV